MYTNSIPHNLSESNRRMVDINGSSLRLYQVWKGNNIFFLGGRLIFGPDTRSLFLTMFLILTPVILFCAFVSERLVNVFPHHLGRLVMAICVVFTAFTIFLLLLTSGRDPGIVPRNLHPPEPDDEGDTSSMSTDWAGSQSAAPSLPPTKDVVVNGMMVRIKYCRTCMLYRPPRCSHCSICNNCIERFDHHCPWVGQCIGKRNYRSFFMFVSSTTVLCLYVFSFCCINIKKLMEEYNCDIWKAVMESPVSGVLILYTFVASWFVGGLTTFHLYLISTNQTTYENFRYRYDGKMNPYNLGCGRNIREIFLSKTPSSKNNFRAKVKSDSSSIFSTSMSLAPPISPEMPKTSFDIEMGKRRAVDAEEFEDIQSQIESIGGLERCGTLPTHTSLNHKGSWEITPDIHMLAAEFGMEHGVSEREDS
ncbi:probable protein S-acyltransferase 7 [Cornus florida]|uniref:probable protein S-acyltransferase 7 n=1 Tax=Cornus florida TaxID=4283 RepID=UPI00289FF71F|nr:probable protein S-acyltransferase 7 [Cornus florida]XP_059633382.1 probable protein S-acyltransferase 7 [Cornus florida]